jgi:hypothetical protein
VQGRPLPCLAKFGLGVANSVHLASVFDRTLSQGVQSIQFYTTCSILLLAHLDCSSCSYAMSMCPTPASQESSQRTGHPQAPSYQ